MEANIKIKIKQLILLQNILKNAIFFENQGFFYNFSI